MVIGETISGPIVSPNVSINNDAEIGDFVLIGVTPRGRHVGELSTAIGHGAVIRSHTVIYAGNQIGERFQTGHGTLVREENEIGDDVSIGSHTVVEHHVSIGNRVRIHSNAFIPEYSKLEDECWVGPHVVLTNARYPASRDVKKSLRGPVIKRQARIGANCTILPGIVIGAGSLIGAGSVVTKDVPDGMVVAGNPARVIGPVSRLDAYD